MEKEILIVKLSNSFKRQLNKNGFKGGTVRIEILTFTRTNLPETKKPIPFVGKEGEMFLHIIHY